jgi:hypothetical protein
MRATTQLWGFYASAHAKLTVAVIEAATEAAARQAAARLGFTCKTCRPVTHAPALEALCLPAGLAARWRREASLAPAPRTRRFVTQSAKTKT